MQEQTSVRILLLTVIILAILSLIIIFYQYNKYQTQFTARAFHDTVYPVIPSKPVIILLQDPRLDCVTPNCYYDTMYRVGADIITTGTIDVTGQNIQACHSVNTKLTLKTTTKPCSMQTIQCISGGWTLASPQQPCY